MSVDGIEGESLCYDFIIAGIKLRIRSSLPLRAGEKWTSFAASFDEPDHEYILIFDDILPPMPQDSIARGEFIRSSLTGGRPFRTYLKSDGSAYAAVYERSRDCWEIFLNRQLLPWGSEIEHLFPLLGLSRVLLCFDRLLLHGAYIRTHYGGVLFIAPSGTGKTTQAELWRRRMDAQIINGDRAILSLVGDVPMIHGFVHSGSSPDCENLDLPLFAVVGLSQANENSVSVLHGMEAIRSLMSSAYLLPEFREDLPKLLCLAEALCANVPLMHLSCLPDPTAVEQLDRMFYYIINKSQNNSSQSTSVQRGEEE